jgi:hypothetical protein
MAIDTTNIKTFTSIPPVKFAALTVKAAAEGLTIKNSSPTSGTIEGEGIGASWVYSPATETLVLTGTHKHWFFTWTEIFNKLGSIIATA